ncbi:MAG: hypothetical protein ABIE03_02305 [Patescibacteria group bacterium]|nr:hypothetical protein [Patescibacteria group bacterium]
MSESFKPIILVDRDNMGALSIWLRSKAGRACTQVRKGVEDWVVTSDSVTGESSNRIPWILFHNENKDIYYLLVSPDNIEESNLNALQQQILKKLSSIIEQAKVKILFRHFTESDLYPSEAFLQRGHLGPIIPGQNWPVRSSKGYVIKK